MQTISPMLLEQYLQSRFPSRSHTKEGLLADLVADLRSANYMMVDQLDRLLVRWAAAAEQLDR